MGSGPFRVGIEVGVAEQVTLAQYRVRFQAAVHSREGSSCKTFRV